MTESNFVVKSTINDVYLHPKNKFRIPRFQRPYSWEEKEITEFWETLISAEPTFLGTIIFNIKDKDAEDIIEIVDGQQRYTSLVILGAVLRDIVIEKGIKEKKVYKDIADGFNKTFIGNSDLFDSQKFDNYLITHDTLKDFFLKNIQKYPDNDTEKISVKTNTKEEEKVLKAYFKFKELVTLHLGLKDFDKTSDELKRLTQRIISKHYFVKIEINDEDLAYEIFETVNAKGIDLNVADLIKNQIFKNVNNSKDNYIDYAKQIWTEITEKLNDNDFSIKDFLSYYWTSRYEYIPERKLYSKIKNRFQNNDDWRNFLDDLKIHSEYLDLIFSGNIDNIKEALNINHKEATKIFESLRILRNIKAKTWIILYLTLFRKIENNPDFYLDKNWLIIQKFTFVYFQVLNSAGNWYFSLIKEFSNKLNLLILEEKNIKAKYKEFIKENLFKSFKDKIPSYNEFELGFKEIKYKNDSKSRVVIRYIFNEIENYYGGISDEGYDENKVNIEHLLPTDPKEWSLKKSDIKKHVNNLGNLTLTSIKANSRLGNKRIEEKIQILKNSKFKLNKDIIENFENNQWDFKLIYNKDFTPIDDRTIYLCKIAHKIWADKLKNEMGF